MANTSGKYRARTCVAASLGSTMGEPYSTQVQQPINPDGSSVFSRFECASLLFRSQQREQDHVADGFRAGEEHGEPIHPETEAAGRRHAVLERQQKFLVDILLLFSRLLNQTLTLHNWIV